MAIDLLLPVGELFFIAISTEPSIFIPSTSYVYILVFLHLAHLFAGIIVLTVVTTKFNRQKYEKNKLGFEMALIFWHFLGALWIYLFFFIKYFS